VLVITGNDDSQTQIKAFRAGANDFVTKPFIQEALISRIRSLLLIRKQYQAIRLQAAQMQRMSASDKLTGAYDRSYFVYHGEQMLRQLESQPLCVLNFGIDDLPGFNQRHGRPSGDASLKTLVQVAQELLPPGTIVSRFGGETFYALLPNCRRDQGQRQAEKLRRAMAEGKPQGIEVSISLGLVSGQVESVGEINDLIAAAEQALARAREGGSNRISVWKGDPADSARAGEARST
jgi:two-component system cell cycle response regulator